MSYEYQVWCLGDPDEGYVLASRRVFKQYVDAVAYVTSIVPSRCPVVVYRRKVEVKHVAGQPDQFTVEHVDEAAEAVKEAAVLQYEGE